MRIKLLSLIFRLLLLITYSIIIVSFLTAIQTSKNVESVINYKKDIQYSIGEYDRNEEDYYKYSPLQSIPDGDNLSLYDGLLSGIVLSLPIVLTLISIFFPKINWKLSDDFKDREHPNGRGVLLLFISFPALIKILVNVVVPLFNSNKAPFTFHFAFINRCLLSSIPLSQACVNSYKYGSRAIFVFYSLLLIMAFIIFPRIFSRKEEKINSNK